ncbi:MAG TPA: IPT/TIG domain-containing protein [Thermoanaerobaculia bacterium]|nr:IPT/TIG domain-containing protein [Thermoanaerobaculia bacterium]
MRFKLIAAVLALAASSAFAQFPQPTIDTIQPAEGTARGGTLVTITGAGFESCPPYLVGCTTATVVIGGRVAEVVEVTGSRVVVRTPSNSSGTYDVVVTTRGGTARRVNAFTYGSRAFVRLLLPTFIEGEAPGAHDSRWRTELTGFLRGSGSARVTDDPDAPSSGVVGAGTFVPLVGTARPGQGRFIYVTTEAAELLTLNLRARDLSSPDNLGVEIPVIRSAATFGPDSVIAILNVPIAAQYRQKLRIYDFDGELGRTVRVNIDGVVTRDIVLSAAAESGDFPEYPGYAELDLNLIPELIGRDAVTVTIDTPAEGRFWAYVSVTNNDTQQVTVVTP